MINNIIPLIYVLAVGFAAYKFCNLTFPADRQLGPRHIAFFAILTTTGFLLTAILPAPYAVFLLVSILSILFLAPVEPVPRIAVFLFLCPVLPNLDMDLHIGIPFMWMTWPRLLSIIILLPLLLRAFSKKSALYYSIDKYIWAFFLFNAALAFRDTSFTNGLRGITYLAVDYLAPYFVLSRYLRSFDDIREVLFPLLGVLVFAALINVFETVRHWHVYDQLVRNTTGAIVAPTQRLGILRATGTFGIPSQAGFALATGLGLCWALAPSFDRRKLFVALITVLAAGLFVTFSRGNWIAGVIIGMCSLFAASRKQFFKAAAALTVVAVVLSSFEFSEDLMSVLPFVGAEQSEAAQTVSYRQELLATSIAVANEKPWFGSTTFHLHPDMEALRQASGLLDLVNHYLIVLLSTGYVGLGLFLLIFLSALAALQRAVRHADQGRAADVTLCRAIMCTLAAQLVAITTTSALGRVGLFMWCLVAIAAVASNLLAPVRVAERRSEVAAEAFADR